MLTLGIVMPILLVIVYIVINGAGAITWEFLTAAPRQGMKAGGIFPAIVGTILLVVGTMLFSLPWECSRRSTWSSTRTTTCSRG